MHKRINAFERYLAVQAEDIFIEFRGFPNCPWADFILNPRRLRGSDFLMKWSQGVWSENRLIEAVNDQGEFFALPYGPSSVAPDNDVRAFELYFERLDEAGLGDMKRPDLLIFDRHDREEVQQAVAAVGGDKQLPFTKETDPSMRRILSKAHMAIECENSLWVAEKMPGFGQELRPMTRLKGKSGLPKSAVVPTVIIKEQDRKPLIRWQDTNKVPIHVWHVFFDRAYGIALSKAEALLDEGLIIPTSQIFQAPNGTSQEKVIYKIYYHYAYALGRVKNSPRLEADYIQDKNGHILPYVKFDGGTLALDEAGLSEMRNAGYKNDR